MSCALGRCLSKLATGYLTPQFVAVDSSYVYWTNYTGGTVVKVPIGGGPPAILASGLSYPQSIAVDSYRVYWASYSDGTVKQASLSTGTITTLASITSSQTTIFGIAIDNSISASFVYFTATGAGLIEHSYVNGYGSLILASGRNLPFGIAVDSASIYWSEGGNLVKMPIGGTTIAALTTMTGASPYYLALDSSYVYWTNFASAGTIMKTAKDGSSTTQLASNQNNPFHIAVDSSNVYWTNIGGTVMKVGIGGGTPTLLASGQTPIGIAVDSTSVYWANQGTNSNDGTVMKLTPK